MKRQREKVLSDKPKQVLLAGKKQELPYNDALVESVSSSLISANSKDSSANGSNKIIEENCSSVPSIERRTSLQFKARKKPQPANDRWLLRSSQSSSGLSTDSCECPSLIGSPKPSNSPSTFRIDTEPTRHKKPRDIPDNLCRPISSSTSLAADADDDDQSETSDNSNARSVNNVLPFCKHVSPTQQHKLPTTKPFGKRKLSLVIHIIDKGDTLRFGFSNDKNVSFKASELLTILDFLCVSYPHWVFGVELACGIVVSKDATKVKAYVQRIIETTTKAMPAIKETTS